MLLMLMMMVLMAMMAMMAEQAHREVHAYISCQPDWETKLSLVPSQYSQQTLAEGRPPRPQALTYATDVIPMFPEMSFCRTRDLAMKPHRC